MDRGPSDEDLVRRAVAGDRPAFADLVRRHEARVYNIALRMLGRPEDARDAAQDTFVTVFRKLDRFRGESAFTTWLYRVASNACYDALRRRRRDPIPVDEIHPASGPVVPDPADIVTAGSEVREALAQVPADFRLVLILHDGYDLPFEDIAAIAGIPVGTAKSRLHRGRVALGRLLGSDAGEPEEQGRPSNSVERP